jgi:OOP family OmpA-OmpF porin
VLQTDAAAAGNKLVAFTVRTGDRWSPPEYLKIAGFRTTSNRNDFFLAPGNRILFLSLINEDSIGCRDLYISRRLPDGSWSKPQDLGPEVNSPEEDISPFVAPDGISLYFSSARQGGEGGHDIYLAKRLDDSWLRWSKPVNLGPEINTPQDEMNLTVDVEGRYAFLAMGEIMKEDIYVFDLPEAMRPVPTAFVKGRAHDPGDQPVAARITYERLRDGVGAGEANADRERGNYRIALRIGEEYGFRGGGVYRRQRKDRPDQGRTGRGVRP